jgi:prohibitin 2
MSNKNNYNNEQSVLVIAGIAVLILVLGFFMLTAQVPAGTVGIQDTMGSVSNNTLPSGFHFKGPFTGIYAMDIKTQKYSSIATSASKDLQDVKTEVTLNYRVEASQAIKMYTEVGRDFEVKVVVPAVQEAVKAATAEFTAAELIVKRPLVKLRVEEILSQRLVVYNLVVETVSLTEFTFSEQFTASIENKVKAEQDALRAENDLRRIQIEKEQQITQAEAIAEATRLQADAEAHALRVVREQLEKNNELIEYLRIQKWNGELPKVTGGISPLMNITDLIN